MLEASLHTLIDSADQQINEAQAAFESDRALLTNAVVAFSVVAVAVALLLGFVLSWAFILPIRRMGTALAGITAGDLSQRVDVPNGDEFGQLARDLNQTSARLTELFEEQRALTARLEETNASLARASEAKSRFLASVSHELRTPMNAILGFTDALLGGVDGPLNPEQTASLNWVQRGGRDLLGLINEILDLSKIEAGRLTIDAAAVRPARARRDGGGPIPLARRPEGAQLQLGGSRSAGRGRPRPAAGQPDPRQPVRQRPQVHPRGRGPGRDERCVRVRVPCRGPGLRARDRPRAARGDLRGVPPGRGRGGRHRSRPRDQPPAGPGHGWRRHARQRSPEAGARSTSRCRSTAGPSRSPRRRPSRIARPTRPGSC